MQQPLTEGVYYILLALHEPCHGYGMMQFAEEMSGGRVKLGAGTTYGALKTLQEKGWIETIAGEGRKKEYVITAEGRHVVQQEILRLKELYENGQKVMGGLDG